MPKLTILQTYPAPARGPAGLAWDGRYLWNTDYSTAKIFCLQPDTAEPLRSFNCPGSLSGLAWDGRSLWQVMHMDGWLRRINPETGVGTEIGPTGVETLGFGDTISDISFRSSDGVLFAYLEAGDALGVINKTTGAVTALGRSFVGCCGNGLAFSPTDMLYHSNEDSLHTLNQVTGQATIVAPMGFSPPADFDPRINSMDFQPGTGILFGSLNDGNSSTPENYLVTVNTTTGVVTIIGRTVNRLDGLAFRR